MKSSKKPAQEKPITQTVKLEHDVFVRLKTYSAESRRTNQDILHTALIEYLRKMKG
jgi:hypothetical protein